MRCALCVCVCVFPSHVPFILAYFTENLRAEVFSPSSFQLNSAFHRTVVVLFRLPARAPNASNPSALTRPTLVRRLPTHGTLSRHQQPLPQTVVDRLHAVVADGGPAAANLGRLARTVSAQLGFREQGSTAAAADSARPYLGGAAQDPELLAAEASLGLGLGLGVVAGATPMPTVSGLRSAGKTLGRQAHSAFEAMATAADVNKGNPALLPNVISHQLGPLPRLLDGLVSGCTAVVPSPSASTVPAAAGGGGGGGGGVAKDGASSPPLSNKRAKESDDADFGRPEKKIALGERGEQKSGLASSFPASGGGGGDSAGIATVKSENGQGASSSPATVAPPASSNLLARPASADFRHGGGEELMALLKAKVGRLFSLDAEYTHVRMGDVPQNGTPAARGGEGTKDEGKGGASANGSAVASTAAEEDAKRATGGGGGGLRRVVSRLRAERAGQFVVHIKFDVAGENACRPCDVSVLSWNEAQESGVGGNAGVAAGGAVKTDGEQNGAGDFMAAVGGSTPWRTSQHTAFVRVSGHAFQVRGVVRVYCLLHARPVTVTGARVTAAFRSGGTVLYSKHDNRDCCVLPIVCSCMPAEGASMSVCVSLSLSLSLSLLSFSCVRLDLPLPQAFSTTYPIKNPEPQ